MPAKKYFVNLSEDEREYLQVFVRTGRHAAREMTRARILLPGDGGKAAQADAGGGGGEEERGGEERGSQTDTAIARVLSVSPATVGNVRKRYCLEGLAAALTERPRPGRPPLITPRVAAHLVTLACSEPPEGFARWSLRLLADKLVSLELVPCISHEAVRKVLKKRAKTLAEETMVYWQDHG